MTSHKTPIKPNPTRWSPSSDPASIVVPGLDTDASTADQIEQIEQLITIKLQNIDENFAKIHNVLANKLLPAVKRFAVGTEPVREAAKFWTSFYEAAAQIRIPTVDDYSTVNEVPSEREEGESTSHEEQKDVEGNTYEEEATMTRPRQEIYETSAVNSETSFLPGQGAVSSTPAMSRQPTMTMTDQSYATQGSDGPSWTPSLESPLVRLNRELNNFSTGAQDDDSILPSTSILPRPGATLPSSGTRPPSNDTYDDSADFTFQQMSRAPPGPSPRSEKSKGKSKEAAQPLLKNVLRHNLYSASDNSSFESNTIRSSPSKTRGKPKTPTIDKGLNPYLRGDSAKDNHNSTNTSNWSGIVDLRDQSMLTPQRKRSARAPNTGTTTTTTPYGNAGMDDEDDSFDGLPPGMSPLRLMSPVPPPRSSAELGLLRLGPTPARDASARIQRDLLRDVLQSGGVPNSARRLGTFSKYDDSTSISTVSGNSPSQSRYGLKNFKQNRYGQCTNDYSTSSSTNITKDSSLESMIRHIKDDIHPDVGITPGMGSTPGLRIRPRGQAGQGVSQIPLARTYEEAPPQKRLQISYDSSPSEPATPMYGHHPFDHLQQGNDEIIDDGDLSSDSDSLDDEINNTAHPSAAFLMASQRRVGMDDDDSFGSSNHSSDSLNAVDEDIQGLEGAVPLHPFEGVVVEDRFDDEDSFDDGVGTQEETVFGAQPYARGGRSGPEANRLRMLGEELDTMAIESRFAGGLKVAETPTPASRAT